MTDMAMTFDAVPPELNPVHLLLIGDTKTGKSTYAARAAKDGFRLLYADSDNGASALRNSLRDDPEAMKRIHYIRTNKPTEFLIGVLKSTVMNPFQWIVERDIQFGVMVKNLDPSHRVMEFRAPLIPPQLLLVNDSWTSCSGDALGLGAQANSVDILEMGQKMQGVYGDANQRLTLICNLMQKVQCHVLNIAHGTFWERYEKPIGKGTKDMKQGEMILKETIQIPVSSSRPHGHSMGSKFNHIGWLKINRVGEVEIDFLRAYDRVGGGPPNKVAPIGNLAFSRLVDPVNGVTPPDPGHVNSPDSWLYVRTVGEILEAAASKPKVAASSQPAPALKAGNLGQLATLKK